VPRPSLSLYARKDDAGHAGEHDARDPKHDVFKTFNPGTQHLIAQCADINMGIKLCLCRVHDQKVIEPEAVNL